VYLQKMIVEKVENNYRKMFIYWSSSQWTKWVWSYCNDNATLF